MFLSQKLTGVSVKSYFLSLGVIELKHLQPVCHWKCLPYKNLCDEAQRGLALASEKYISIFMSGVTAVTQRIEVYKYFSNYFYFGICSHVFC